MRSYQNQVVYHLSRLDGAKMDEVEFDIDDTFPDEQVLFATLDRIPWFADYGYFMVSDLMHEGLTYQQKKNILHDVGKYFLVEPYLYRVCVD